MRKCITAFAPREQQQLRGECCERAPAAHAEKLGMLGRRRDGRCQWGTFQIAAHFLALFFCLSLSLFLFTFILFFFTFEALLRSAKDRIDARHLDATT